ncbi:MAG TPA: FHA domain-containing protein, partial [Albitalea sp.]
MLAIEMPAPRLARDEPRPAATPAVAHDLDVVLQPLSRPDLPAIRLDEGMLAIGRNEPPFASCGEDVLAMLSRRHARVFCEGGAAWVADLGSCNGTTVNRV